VTSSGVNGGKRSGDKRFINGGASKAASRNNAAHRHRVNLGAIAHIAWHRSPVLARIHLWFGTRAITHLATSNNGVGMCAWRKRVGAMIKRQRKKTFCCASTTNRRNHI